MGWKWLHESGGTKAAKTSMKGKGGYNKKKEVKTKAGNIEVQVKAQ